MPSASENRNEVVVETLLQSYADSIQSFERTAREIAEDILQNQSRDNFYRFLFEVLYALDLPLDDLYAAVDRILAPDDRQGRVNSGIIYLTKNGARADVLELVLYYLLSRNMHSEISDLREYAIRHGKHGELSLETHFNIAHSLLSVNKVDLAFKEYMICLSMNPDQDQITLVTSNIALLATHYNHGPSIDYIGHARQRLLSSYRQGEPTREDGAGFHFAASDHRESQIARSLLENGVCVIHGACDPTTIDALKRYLTTELQSAFPASFDARILQLISQLYRVDLPAIMAAAFDGPSALNVAACVARKVSPNISHSQTPFHQDVSAFLAPVINVWTPLTGSGGDFPSIEFVRKRINWVEETILAAGQYNQVEIAEASVLDRYQALLYEYESPTPGDCVIFLGSTIHRTSNLRAATQDRLSLEVRYARSPP